jgi:hypothetical protein
VRSPINTPQPRVSPSQFFSDSAGLAQTASVLPKIRFGARRKVLPLLVLLKLKNAGLT